jgi:hypothetical protein
MRRASSETTTAEPPLMLNEMVPVDVGPASQSSQEAEDAEFLSPQQVPEPEKLEMLDETLLHSPYGSKDPYQFYHVLKVEIKATLPQIEVAYRKISMLYHPDRHATNKDVWTAQFQILSTIKCTLTNTEERQKYNRQSRKAAQNAEREGRRAAEAPPNGEREHVREREAAPPPPPARTSRRASNAANPANADPPPSHRASGHTATKAIMQRHMETINRLKGDGKALEQDVDNLITLFHVYDTLPLRRNEILEGENWNAVDPMKPLGQPVGKRFVRTDYAGYIVGFTHRREGGSYLFRYEDGDLLHLPARELDT